MRKSKYFLAVLGALFCAFAGPRPARAQFIGFSSPQTVQQTLAPALTACTGVAQNFPVQNLGQTQHFASIVATNTNVSIALKIQGLDVNGNIFTISDVAFGSGIAGANPTVTASGYFPVIRVVVICSGGTFTLSYSGASSTPNVISGAYLSAQVDKSIFSGLPANLSFPSGLIVPPFGSTAGTLAFQFTTAANAGATLNVVCVGNGVNNTYWTEVFTIANTLAMQSFSVGGQNCGLLQVTYTTGGGAGTVALDYLFTPPGLLNPTLASYTHITGTTATTIKGTAGSFLGVNINTAAAGTVSVFDLGAAACTGTPSTNVVAVITVNATDPPHATPFNVYLSNGICVKASVGMDLTVGAN
jgi:hypothetical protein